MKKISVVVLFLMVGVGLAHAQVANIPGVGNSVIMTKKYEDIKGSAYLYDTWISGTLTSKEGEEYTNVMLRYDAYKDRIEVNQNNQVMEINSFDYPKFTFTFFKESNDKVVKHNFASGYDVTGFPKSSYFDILYQGDHTVLKKVKKFFTEVNVSSYGPSEFQKVFEENNYYFVANADGVIKEVKLSKKSVIGAFPEKKEIIEKFLSVEKLKLKTQDDLVALFQYIDGAGRQSSP